MYIMVSDLGCIAVCDKNILECLERNLIHGNKVGQIFVDFITYPPVSCARRKSLCHITSSKIRAHMCLLLNSQSYHRILTFAIYYSK